MNWEALGAVGEIVGAIAVLITLVYLAAQIRQNAISTDKQTDIARAQILQSRADSVANLVAVVTSQPENFELMVKLQTADRITREDLSSEEYTRAHMLLQMLRANLENTYLQYKQGYLPEEFYLEVSVKNNLSMGKLLLDFDIPLTESFRAELLRNLAEAETKNAT